MEIKVDTSENLNQTWVNNSVRTAPLITPNHNLRCFFKL